MKISEITNNVQLFQDLDGCLADFDKRVRELTGSSSSELGQARLWAKLGDQTIKSGSHHHMIMKFTADESQAIPKKYTEMKKIIRSLYGAGMLDSEELTDDGLRALDKLETGQDYTIKKDFYNTLDWMPDGKWLWNYVGPKGAVVLTGRPMGNWAEPQKREWCKRELGLGNDRVLVGLARDKPKMAAEFLGRPLDGDILIDDRPMHQAGWEQAGGVWITHTSAASSIKQLKEIL